MRTIVKRKVWSSFGVGMSLALLVGAATAIPTEKPSPAFYKALMSHVEQLESSRRAYLRSGKAADFSAYKVAAAAVAADVPCLTPAGFLNPRHSRRLEDLIRKRMAREDVPLLLGGVKKFTGGTNQEDVQRVLRIILKDA